MWDAVQEKSMLLSHVGDFWYKGLREEDVPIAHSLSHLATQCRIIRQIDNISDMARGGGFFKDNFLLITFKDEDVIWFGKKDAVQQQHHVGYLPNSDETGNSRADDFVIPGETLLQDDDNRNVAIPQETVAFPDEANDIELAKNRQNTYGLRVDPDVRVTSILMKDSTVLYEHQDFISQYGRIIFRQSPHSLFPEMRFIAKSYEYRKRNLYCYPLGVDVYGPVDRIINYVRKYQSSVSLYYASAQAAGFPIVNQDCEILSVAPLGEGVIYYTDHGKYAAPFQHKRLHIGNKLTQDTIVGGDELYRLVYPDVALPSVVEAISLDYALPVKGLIAQNKEISVRTETDKLRPMFTGDEESLAKYHKWLEEYDGTDYSSIPETMNAITLVRRYLCANRCLIACVNVHRIPGDMYHRLIAFLRRELPLGSVLTVADMPIPIDEIPPTTNG